LPRCVPALRCYRRHTTRLPSRRTTCGASWRPLTCAPPPCGKRARGVPSPRTSALTRRASPKQQSGEHRVSLSSTSLRRHGATRRLSGVCAHAAQVRYRINNLSWIIPWRASSVSINMGKRSALRCRPWAHARAATHFMNGEPAPPLCAGRRWRCVPEKC